MLNILMIIALAHAETSQTEHCASQHFKDALLLNQSRKNSYAALSDGNSLSISRQLIAYDRLLLPIARYLDSRSKKHHTRSGRPLLCELLPRVIGETPIILKTSQPEPSIFFSVGDWKTRLKAIRKTKDWKSLEAAVDEVLLSDSLKNPAYMCMTRQYFLTLKRLSQIVPEHKNADRFGWNLTRWFSLGLKSATALDQKAIPLQSQGIPILCADLSPLPHF